MTPRNDEPPPARRPIDREQVISAASQLSDAEGLDKLTLTRVAGMLGVRQPLCIATSAASTIFCAASASGVGRSWLRG